MTLFVWFPSQYYCILLGWRDSIYRARVWKPAYLVVWCCHLSVLICMLLVPIFTHGWATNLHTEVVNTFAAAVPLNGNRGSVKPISPDSPRNSSFVSEVIASSIYFREHLSCALTVHSIASFPGKISKNTKK